jgi:hypothetical protein
MWIDTSLQIRRVEELAPLMVHVAPRKNVDVGAPPIFVKESEKRKGKG